MAAGMGFLFEAGKTPAQVERYNEIMRTAVQRGTSADHLQTLLRLEGLGMRRTNMLADYRRYTAIAHIDPGKTDSINRALEYYDAVIEPYWKEKGGSIRAIWARVKQYNTGVYESDEAELEIEEDLVKYPKRNS